MGPANSENLQRLASAGKLERMHRSWRLRLAGWGLIAAMVLAGAAGLFGNGPLSSTSRSAGGMTVEFEQFVRRGTPFILRTVLRIEPLASEARLSVSKHFLAGIRISSVSPQPVQAVTGSEAVTFLFAVEDTASALPVSIHYEPLGAGVLDGTFAAGGSRVEIRQFVWP
jgi:hypothetical protein